MRVTAPLLAASLLLAPAASTSGAHQEGAWTWVRFEAPVPCSFTCAYWVDTANTDIDGDGDPEVYFHACARPFPPGAYDDVVVDVPPGADLLQFHLYPFGDWDGFVCAPDGDWLRGTYYGEYLCDNVAGPNSFIPLGCSERFLVGIPPGLRKIVLRAYNWADGPFVWGEYRFLDWFA